MTISITEAEAISLIGKTALDYMRGMEGTRESVDLMSNATLILQHRADGWHYLIQGTLVQLQKTHEVKNVPSIRDAVHNL